MGEFDRMTYTLCHKTLNSITFSITKVQPAGKTANTV